MPAMEKILALGLYNITALEPLIDEGYTLLTPNSRLARRIKSEWDERRRATGDRSWEALPVLPLEHWLIKKWERALSLGLVAPITPLSSDQTLELWRQVIVEQERDSADFHLLNPAAAAELASDARDTLLRWQVDMEDSHLRQSFTLDGDCGTFLQWLTVFNQRLAENKQCTAVDCLAQIPQLAGQFPKDSVALVEFDEVPPLLDRALLAMSHNVRSAQVDTLEGEQFVHAFSDERAELHTVATWAADQYRNDPRKTIGIVLPDMGATRVTMEYLLRRAFDCLGARYGSLPVNFSVGMSLARTPLVRDALQVLAVGLREINVQTLVDLLQSRFLDIPDSQGAATQDFISSLFAEGREVLSLRDVCFFAGRISARRETGLRMGTYLLAMAEMPELQRVAKPSHWIPGFTRALDLWGWPGPGGLDSLEYQQFELWGRLLEQFRALDGVCGPVNFAEALRLLRDSCHRQIFQPQTVDSQVQVLGPLEAAGLTFNHLWICGMQGSRWPESPRPNPFIPVALQARLRMPHATTEREWDFSEALFTRYKRSCEVLHASYSRQIDGVPDLPSRLIHDFPRRELPEMPLVSEVWRHQFTQRSIEVLADRQAPPLSRGELLGVKGGSGLIEDQSQCPFRAFARRRLKTEPLPRFRLALSAAERGALLHDALCVLWGEINTSAALHGLDAEAERDVIARAVEAAIAAAPRRRRRWLGERYWQLEARRLDTLLGKWLQVERQRSAFLVAAREQEMTLQIAGLPIHLRVDRIDELPDGSRVIIDYKTGSCNVQDLLGSRPAHPQLLLYAMGESDVAALAFAQVRPQQCRYLGLGRVAAAPGISQGVSPAVQASMGVERWEELEERWRENLKRLAQAFVDGDASIDPLGRESCNWCGLQPLCRIDLRAGLIEIAGE